LKTWNFGWEIEKYEVASDVLTTHPAGWMTISRSQHPAVVSTAFEMTVIYNSLLSSPFISTVRHLDKRWTSVNPAITFFGEIHLEKVECDRISVIFFVTVGDVMHLLNEKKFIMILHDNETLAEKVNFAKVNPDVIQDTELDNQPTTSQPTFSMRIQQYFNGF
jgi:hypothetical protein